MEDIAQLNYTSNNKHFLISINTVFKLLKAIFHESTDMCHRTKLQRNWTGGFGDITFFSIFKIAAIRYFEIFGQPLDWEAQCVSPYQISVKRLLRYRTQQFSNWRPSTILDF